MDYINSFMNETIVGCLESAIKYRHCRVYDNYVNGINSTCRGYMRGILESSRTPKDKNIELLKCLVENKLIIDCVSDNINPGYPFDTVGGREVSAR